MKTGWPLFQVFPPGKDRRNEEDSHFRLRRHGRSHPLRLPCQRAVEKRRNICERAFRRSIPRKGVPLRRSCFHGRQGSQRGGPGDSGGEAQCGTRSASGNIPVSSIPGSFYCGGSHPGSPGRGPSGRNRGHPRHAQYPCIGGGRHGCHCTGKEGIPRFHQGSGRDFLRPGKGSGGDRKAA